MKTLYILTFFIFAVSVVQIIVFTLHPSQKYYKDNIVSLRQEFTNFQNQVVKDFIPLIEKNIKIVPRGTQNNQINGSQASNQPFILPCITNVVSLSAKPYTINGKTYFRYNGFDYKTGDIFEGFRLIHISPSIARTIHKSYLFAPREEAISSRFVNPLNTPQ